MRSEILRSSTEEYIENRDHVTIFTVHSIVRHVATQGAEFLVSLHHFVNRLDGLFLAAYFLPLAYGVHASFRSFRANAANVSS